MAQKLPGSRKGKTASAPAPAGADDLQVMHPNVDTVIAGRRLTLREYGHVEGLRVRAYMRPFTADLDRLSESGSEILTEDVIDLVAVHTDLVHLAVAQSMAPIDELASDEDVAWIRQLGDRDGDALLLAWWGATGLFFLRQVMRRAGERNRRKVLAGATSMASSPKPGTETPIASGDTPSGKSDSSTNA